MHTARILLVVLFFIFTSVFFIQSSYATYDPLSKPNNFFGVHILFPEELPDAAKLVNSSGGDWGYVTIPIQAGDRNLEKWQTFMDDAYRYHIIPIIRLATESFYKNTNVWRKPNEYDIVDFANFLQSLAWPTKNKYVILFNEVNRFDEWGGEYPNPLNYSDLVEFAIDTFKVRDDNFFLILGGLDNASFSDGIKYMGEFDYLQQIANYKSSLFDKVDGFASHSYPNPAFSSSPSKTRKMGTGTYRHEYSFINSFTRNPKQVFITETGWDSDAVPPEKIAAYYMEAFEDIWKKDFDKIVAITPFLLKSEHGSFDMFSFFKNGAPTQYALMFQSLSKVNGEPLLADGVKLGKEKEYVTRNIPRQPNIVHKMIKIPEIIKSYIKTILGMS